MQFRKRNLKELAELICGDNNQYFIYRKGAELTEFFKECDTQYAHDGSTRYKWVAEILNNILCQSSSNMLHEDFCNIIKILMDKRDAYNEDHNRTKALNRLNEILNREGWIASYDNNGICQISCIENNVIMEKAITASQSLSIQPSNKKKELTTYLNKCSEDELISEVLLPLFRKLGFQHIVDVGHKDKSLEYGTDIWMKYVLPTRHALYFGIQVKKGKLDASGKTKRSHSNVSEILNQVRMMIGNKIFDQEISKKVLVDHMIIIAGGEITKQARNWIGEQLSDTQRSQILFMDRDYILDLYTSTELSIPNDKLLALSKKLDQCLNPLECLFSQIKKEFSDIQHSIEAKDRFRCALKQKAGNYQPNHDLKRVKSSLDGFLVFQTLEEVLKGEQQDLQEKISSLLRTAEIIELNRLDTDLHLNIDSIANSQSFSRFAKQTGRCVELIAIDFDLLFDKLNNIKKQLNRY